MPGQKISTLTPVSDLQSTDQFVLARSGSTYKISGDKFIPKPASASAQQVLTYNSSTSTWVASALPAGNSGTVTSVTGNLPISVANGTTTPAISIAAATTSAAGTMSSTDKTRLDDASTVNGLLSCNGSGDFAAAIAGIDYLKLSNFTGANQSLMETGYQKLPNGLIIQWGVVMVADGTRYQGTFPITFNDRGYTMVATSALNVSQISAVIYVQTNIFSKSAYHIVSEHSASSAGINAVYWLAIGY